ncbi:hypothetical protein [Bradyrhizobium roseum]|uniref:hypothetical protein n=1 Tax=Bradyrhizobium roseum TaxID=3056648 RepID=UPI00262FC94C|nr:hypothetical protein [Bradyrhizobium roseus]WKA29810.1 hypothetical protein QUH67_06445 [Bradyrhizobium roseus]
MLGGLLADLIIILSVVVAGLTLLDFYLSPKQKAWFNDKAVAAWVRLDELKSFSLVEWWRDGGKWQWTILALSWAFFLYAASIPHPSGTEPIPGPPWVGYLAAIMTASMLGRWTIKYILPVVATSPRSIFFWLLPFLVCGVTAFGLYGLNRYPPVPGQFNFSSGLFGITAFFGSMITLAWMVAVLPLVLVYLASATLALIEFTVRRIAEYPRGPILALSVFVGGVVAIFRALV